MQVVVDLSTGWQFVANTTYIVSLAEELAMEVVHAESRATLVRALRRCCCRPAAVRHSRLRSLVGRRALAVKDAPSAPGCAKPVTSSRDLRLAQ